jgi:hypothetical protein
MNDIQKIMPVETCGHVRKCMASPQSYMDRLPSYGSKTIARAATLALSELEAARAKDIALHEANLPALENNKTIAAQIVALNEAIGMPKRWSERDRNSRARYPKTIGHDAGYLTDIVREVNPKTQTRRHVKGTALEWLDVHTAFSPEFVALPSNHLCPYGYAGDQIYVKETFFAWGRWETRFNAKKGRDEWHFVDMTLESGRRYGYDADEDVPLVGKRNAGVTPAWWKRPAIFMPRAAVRIWLEVVRVRIERLQDISEADSIAEGIERGQQNLGWFRGFLEGDNPELKQSGRDFKVLTASPKLAYESLWTAINGAADWAANPYVWVVEFKRITGATQ